MSLRSTEWVWRHSPARNGARLVHLALADIARCSSCKVDRKCGCGEVLALWASLGLLEARTGLSRTAVKGALRELSDAGLVERTSGGYGTEACSYKLTIPPDGNGGAWLFDAATGWGYGAGNASEGDTGPVRPSGGGYSPPVESGGNGGSDSVARGSHLDARGSDSDPYTDTDTEKKETGSDSCGELTTAEHLAYLQAARHPVLRHA